MNLPSPIQAYFDADRSDDGDLVIRAFAPDAVVKDEERSYAGRQAIGAWWRAAKDKYQHVIQPLDAGEKGDAIDVRARLSGRFPGSPAVLTFTFRLRDGQIAALEIGA